MIRRPPRSTPKPSSAASDVYKRQVAYPPLPSDDSSRHRNVLIGLVVGLLVLIVLGAVLLFAGGVKGGSGGEPVSVATPSVSSQPEQSSSEDPQMGATSINATPSFLTTSPASSNPVRSSPAPSSPQSPASSARQVADKLPDRDTICSCLLYTSPSPRDS